MRGHAHLATGLLLGATWVTVGGGGPSVWDDVALTAATGGAALWPDLDQTGFSTAKKTWGPLTGALAAVVELVSGGHRGRSHDLVLAPVFVAAAGFGALALPGDLGRGAVAALLALALGCALRGLDWLIPGRLERIWPVNLTASAVAAYLYVTVVDPAPEWLPIALALGVAVHIGGDALTTAGVPVPLSRPGGRTWGLRAFASGAGIEVAITAVALAGAVALVWLHYR